MCPFRLNEVLNGVYSGQERSPEALEYALALTDPADIAALCAFADGVRSRYCGSGVLLRGIIEFSNVCANDCAYCGLGRSNRAAGKYTLSREQILDAAAAIAACGIKTVVLQSGEDDSADMDLLCDTIGQIKRRFAAAVTLSVGEKSREQYRAFRQAGADRYLLKIETVNENLYRCLHPGMRLSNRMRCLEDLRSLGFQTGSGDIIGLKGQSTADIAADLMFFAEQDFDMLGIGPFIPHGGTPLGGEPAGSAEMTIKAVALARILTKNAHIPATTALGNSGSENKLSCLKAGANVLMPHFTPTPYRQYYDIYPLADGASATGRQQYAAAVSLADSAGRYIDYCVGGSLKKSRGVGCDA